MIVAFLDLLGFSQLTENDQQTALDNLYNFNKVLETKCLDDKCHPFEEYQKKYPDNKEFLEWVKNSSTESFKYLISCSDSLIIGSDNVDDFLYQIMNLMATYFVIYCEPFKDKFTDIHNVKSNKMATFAKNGMRFYHNAFPILFRGGLSYGTEVLFHKEIQIINGKMDLNSQNVFGKTYLHAVKLEKTGKGPRLFCDRTVIEQITDEEIKNYIKPVDISKGVYEILWTKSGCEVCNCSQNDIKYNIKNGIQRMLLPALNLLNYYWNSEQKSHYMELLILVIRGILEYSRIKLHNCDYALSQIQPIIGDYLKGDIDIFNLINKHEVNAKEVKKDNV